jgi:hypothetical protein
MFARVAIVHMRKDQIDAAVQLSKDSVIPAAKSQKGFHGAQLLTEPNGKGIFITFWDNLGNAIDNEQNSYYQEQLAKLKDVFDAPPVDEGYNVAFRTD